MDICVLNPYFYPYNGGTEKVLLEVYGRLAKRHNVTVISAALRSSNKDSVEEIGGIRVIRLKSTYLDIAGLPLPFAVIHGVPEAIAKTRADIYHINNRFQFFEGSVNAARRNGGRIALTIHNALPKGIDMHTDALGLFYDSLWGRGLMHKVDVITGISKNTIETTVPRRERHKTHLVYNGVDHQKYVNIAKSDKKLSRIRSGLGIEGRCIVTNGRLITQKGQAYLMEAVAKLIEERKMDLSLVIIGTGPLRERLQEKAARLGIEKNFRIVSGIKEELMPHYYNLGDMFVLPSLYEPASLAILEALACALPCVASRVGGLPEMMGRYGYYAEPKDVEGLMEKIIYVISNKKKAEALGREGRGLMVRRHDWDGIAGQYERLFEEQLRH